MYESLYAAHNEALGQRRAAHGKQGLPPLYVYVYSRVYTYLCIILYVGLVYVCMYVCMHVCVYVYVCVYAHSVESSPLSVLILSDMRCLEVVYCVGI